MTSSVGRWLSPLQYGVVLAVTGVVINGAILRSHEPIRVLFDLVFDTAWWWLFAKVLGKNRPSLWGMVPIGIAVNVGMYLIKEGLVHL